MIRLIRTDPAAGMRWCTEWFPAYQGPGWQADACLVVYRRDFRADLVPASEKSRWVPAHDAPVVGSRVHSWSVPLTESDGGPSLLAYPDDRRDLGLYLGHLAFATLLFDVDLAGWLEFKEPGAGREGETRGVDLPCFAGVDKRDWPLIIIPAAIPGGRERTEGGGK